MTKLLPVWHHLLVEPILEESTTKSWIIITKKEEEKPWKGKVIAVGEWKLLEDGSRWAMDVKVWDIVYFTKYAPDEVEVDENGTKNKYLVIQMTSVLAKIPA